ncbi:MAG: ABC transporter permease [Flavobacteria bacterium RIFCSPLOWO2_12_FULL_31_7]|jgi:MFS family permease|nr:MAG: ABC transporter permease [Flavobacteria bacterium RIFCSPLOWO2_12_FULL_31_7]
MRKIITRNIWILSIVSLFTDISTEMLYPILPLYLKSIGYTVVMIGILEGIAEAISGLSKGYFGALSDRKGVRVPFIKSGYWLSAISRPLMAFSAFPLLIFLSRSMDLLGKGIRTSARDALLSDESTTKTKATVFGFHRMMDTTGAVIGPVIALIYLYYYPNSYKTMFLIAFIPAIISGFTILLVKEKKKTIARKSVKWSFLSSFGYIKTAPPEYKKLLIGLLLFTLFNSTNAFLILKVKESGQSDTMTIAIYIYYNFIYALFSYPMGKLADKIGVKTTMVSGLFIFTIVYIGMRLNTNLIWFFILFFLYGIYMASTEGISRAWLSNLCDKKDTGKALGVYAGLSSVLTLLASSVAGFIWYKYNAQTTFFLTAFVTLLVCFYFLVVIKNPTLKKND